MIARTHQRGRHEDGVVAVEFALVSMLFFVVLFAVLTLGLLFAVNHTLTHSASEGARSALTAPAGEAIATAEAAATTRLGWLAEHAVPSATVDACDSDPGMECVVVTVTYDHAGSPVVPPLPGLGLVIPDSMTRHAVLQITQVAEG